MPDCPRKRAWVPIGASPAWGGSRHVPVGADIRDVAPVIESIWAFGGVTGDSRALLLDDHVDISVIVHVARAHHPIVGREPGGRRPESAVHTAVHVGEDHLVRTTRLLEQY